MLKVLLKSSLGKTQRAEATWEVSVPIDPKLVEIAKTAEAGKPLPVLRLATAAQLLIGRPGGSWHFAEGSRPGLHAEVRHLVSNIVRAQRNDAFNQTLSNMEPDWQRAATLPESDPPTSITLYDALVWGWGESAGLRLPVLRVNLDAVSAWWIGPGEVVKGQGGGLFWGVAIPVGD